jgi:serine/threonine protein kinase
MGARRGIIPVKDAYLPQEPEDGRPWLAMEIGTPIKQAFGHNPSVEEVIIAIADIAGTLAMLAQEGIYHRDIKPDNLFRLGDEWAVGDFGLASFPNKEALTEDGRRLGPGLRLWPWQAVGVPPRSPSTPA